MKYNKNDNVIYFKNDDEFYNFCVDPSIVFVNTKDENDMPVSYTTFNFTNDYTNALNNNTMFMICDEDSVITKHGAVSLGFHTHDVSNLVPYYEY